MKTFFDQFPSTPERSAFGFDFFTDEDLVAFTVTQINSGSVAVIDTNATGRNGIALFANGDSTDDKGAQIQADAETVQVATGKTIRFIGRGYVSAAATMPLLMGLAITDTSLLASAPSDGIYFQKVKGSAVLNLIVRATNATVVSLPLATLADATMVTAAFEVYDVTEAGAGKIRAWINGTLVTTTEVATLPTAEALALTAACQSGAAASQTGGIDFLAVDQTR